MNNVNQDSTNCVLDVLIIGAGFSGICAGIKLLEQGIHNFVIAEKSEGVGGTWYDNTYPGAACDVASHFYCYSFEPNPNWSRIYSPQAEIQEYIRHCADKYEVAPHIRHGARLTTLRLDEENALWRANFADGTELRARQIINGFGGLHKPSIPEFPGRDSFRGPAMHTARWDHSVDFAGKRVAVIGSAASAIQVIPELAKVAKHVAVFQRTANYIAPRNDRDYSDSEKQRFARWPLWQRLYRWWIYKRMDVLLFPVTKKDSKMGKRLGAKVIAFMKASVKDERLKRLVEPDYAMGCKRILLSDDLFPALNRDNVALVDSGIAAIEENGIRDSDGTLHEADIIVYATGFDIEGHMRSIDVFGRDGRLLAEEWSDGQEAYKGCCVAGFPNYWMVTGPNTGVATTSVVFMIEQTVAYIMDRIRQTQPGQLTGVRHAAQDDYNLQLHGQLEHSVWASGCSSWYISDNGKIVTLYPKNAKAFQRQLRNHVAEHFETQGVVEEQSAA